MLRKETAQDPQFFKRTYKDIQRFMESNGFDSTPCLSGLGQHILLAVLILPDAGGGAGHEPVRGHTLEDVHRTVKSLFAAHSLPCVSEGDPLSFQDKGHGDDFACMWDIILSLLRSDWFMATSSAVSFSVETYTEYCRRSKPLVSMNRWISL